MSRIPGTRRGVGDVVPMPLPTCTPWPGGVLISQNCDWGPEAFEEAAVAQGGPNGSLVLLGGTPQPGATAPPAGVPPGVASSTNPPGGFVLGPGGLRIPAPATGAPGAPLPYPGGPYARTPILPDWMLPPELQRSNPSVGILQQRANRYDGKIARQAALWRWIARHGGLKSCCRIPELGAPIYDEDPRIVMPDQAIRLTKMYSAPVASFQDGGGNFTGLDVVVGSFNCEIGYDGVINKVVFGFTGTGHVDFSGDIVWRVKVAQRYAKDLGNVTNAFGSFADAMLVPGSNWPLVSGQCVQAIANVPAGSPIAAGSITMGIFGWAYPHK